MQLEVPSEDYGGPNDSTAFAYLRERGFVFARDHWVVPSYFELNDRDKLALRFLFLAYGYPSRVFEAPPRFKH